MGKGRAQVLAQADLVEEVELIGNHLQIGPGMFLIIVHLGGPGLRLKTLGDADHGGQRGALDELFHLILLRIGDYAGQALAPQARSAAAAALADPLVMALDHQGAPHPHGRQQHDDGKGQGAGNRHALQRLEAAGQQQNRGQYTAEDGPGAALPGRCFQSTPGGQRVDHQGPGVRRGDEEQGDQQHGQEGGHRGEGELLQQLEQRDGVIRLDLIDQLAVALVDDQVQCGVAEYREPEEGEEGGYQHHTEDELADGATTADLGDEQADKGCPGDGPAEDEQGPVADPVTARVGLQVEGPLDDVVQVAAGVLQEGLENEDG